MNILVVYCHPRKQSFNHAIKEAAVQRLQAQGHEVQVADLYAEGFQPAMNIDDFAQFESEPMPTEILREQQRVEWSDGVVFIFPLWWWSLPAMLKGWIDRVMSYGWAYDDPMDPHSGPLNERRILVLMTAGASRAQLEKRDYDKAFHTQVEVGIWDYCGFRDYHLHIFDRINGEETLEQRQGYLKQAGELCAQTFT